MKQIDLHIHTNLSDGMLSPDEIIKLAVSERCVKIAITDHDIINDYSKLSEKYKIPIINGIEFNSSITNLHLLGYNIQCINKVDTYMRNLRMENEGIVIEIIKKLENAAFDISLNKVIDYLKSVNLSIDILDKRKLVKYLIYKEYANSIVDCYKKLIGQNQEFYIPNKKISPLEIINLVKSNGGITVLAHPITLSLNSTEFEKILIELLNTGLDGIEVFNSRLSTTKDNIYSQLSKKYNIVPTYGSDFHDPKSDNIGVLIDDIEYYNMDKCLNLVKKYKFL